MSDLERGGDCHQVEMSPSFAFSAPARLNITSVTNLKLLKKVKMIKGPLFYYHPLTLLTLQYWNIKLLLLYQAILEKK